MLIIGKYRPFFILSSLLLFLSGCGSAPEFESLPSLEQDAPSAGSPAPDFILTDLENKEVRLSDYRGDYVILEWINYECPFVKKHYDTGNMQELQNRYISKGVRWIGISSSAPGKQGYFTAEEWKELAAERGSRPTHILLDPAGEVGRIYRARTTPEIFIVDPEGILVYMGAIDDTPSRNHADIQSAENYVVSAMNALFKGDPVAAPVTQPYGCSVKYGE